MDSEVLTLDGVNSTVCDVQQRQQSFPSQTNMNPSTVCLTRGQAIGLVVSDQLIVLVPSTQHTQLTAETSFLTLFCVIVMFILITVFRILPHVSVWL